MPTTRAQLEAARTVYERLADARTERLLRRASGFELGDAIKAIDAPLRLVADAAGIHDFDERYRLAVVLLGYPYARHRMDWAFEFGTYVRAHAPRGTKAMETLLAVDTSERTAFVRALRRLLIGAHARIDSAAYVDWGALGHDIVTWTPDTAARWARSWRNEAPAPEVAPKPVIVLAKASSVRRAAKPAATSRAPAVVQPTSSRFLAVKDAWFVVRWLKGHAYGYRRVYLGTAGHSKPRYRDEYLGRLNDEIAREGTSQALRRELRKAVRLRNA